MSLINVSTRTLLCTSLLPAPCACAAAVHSSIATFTTAADLNAVLSFLQKKKKTHFLVFFHQTEFSIKCSGVFQKEGIFRWCPLCFAVKAACEGIASTLSVIPVTMGTRCFHKKIEFQRTRQKISVPLGTSTNLRKKSFKLFKNPGNKNSWASEKNSAKCLLEAARFRVLDRHRWTKPTTAP